jgi:hypothetical protein
MRYGTLSRREALTGAAGIAAATTVGLTAAHAATDMKAKGGVHAIPELAPQWKKLDLAEILSRPAAYMSVSQVKSLYEPWGAQAAEKQWERGSLAATVKVAQARARRRISSLSIGSAIPYFARTIPSLISTKLNIRRGRKG